MNINIKIYFRFREEKCPCAFLRDLRGKLKCEMLDVEVFQPAGPALLLKTSFSVPLPVPAAPFGWRPSRKSVVFWSQADLNLSLALWKRCDSGGVIYSSWMLDFPSVKWVYVTIWLIKAFIIKCIINSIADFQETVGLLLFWAYFCVLVQISFPYNGYKRICSENLPEVNTWISIRKWWLEKELYYYTRQLQPCKMAREHRWQAPQFTVALKSESY